MSEHRRLVDCYAPAFSKSGQRLDVTAATIGDAFRGGILLMAPLEVLIAWSCSSRSNFWHPQGCRAEALPPEELAGLPVGARMVASVGAIPGGALVEREIINLNIDSIIPNLKSPDFTTAFRLAKLIDQNWVSHRKSKKAVLSKFLYQIFLDRLLDFRIENMEITPDSVAGIR